MYKIHWRTVHDMTSIPTFDRSEFKTISEAERCAKVRSENTLQVYQAIDARGVIISEWKTGQRFLGNEDQAAVFNHEEIGDAFAS